ncbi:receptor-type tyrosine-protein phosphatase eta-like isoform X2 [Clupea harengus]|uniref:Receptor-type tyrosine-protein phosphatase eta-like isoform X2 n=1 Tax=Clupea harengus TaxID=7950 RepID=A0A8M1K877_CLUHA|nr:receptor-type tyrosine-protein phosphatase eta-like isoform X2 [Clupea harengus]
MNLRQLLTRIGHWTLIYTCFSIKIEREGMVDVSGIVSDMRMHRPFMVKTKCHYVFLNQCALDVIRSKMGTNENLTYQKTEATHIYEAI